MGGEKVVLCSIKAFFLLDELPEVSEDPNQTNSVLSPELANGDFGPVHPFLVLLTLLRHYQRKSQMGTEIR